MRKKQTPTNFVTQQQLTLLRTGKGISHTHPNKDVLDQITAEMLAFWHYDAENKVVFLGDEDNPVSLAAFGEVTAGGVGESPSPTPGVFTSIAYANLSALAVEEMDKVPTAWAAKKMLGRIEALEQGGGGGGNVDDVYVNGVSALGEDKIARIAVPTTLAQLEGDSTHRLVTEEQMEAWDIAVILAHSHNNKEALDLIRYDARHNVVYLGDEDNPVNFAAFGDVTAGGIGSGGGGGAQNLYQLEDIYHNGQTILRSDGTARQNGDAIVYNSLQDKWVAAAVQASGGVTSFNARTGAVTLSSSDVTGALGYTPYNSSNPAGYITSSGSVAYATSAGYADNAGQLGGLSVNSFFRSRGLISTDFDGAGMGMYYSWSSNIPHSPVYDAYGNLISFISGSTSGYNGDTQLYFTDHRMFFRALYGSWNPWYELYHSGNANNTSTPWSANTLNVGSGGIIFTTNGESFDEWGNFFLSANSASWGVYANNRASLLYIDAIKGNVGIGTAPPAYKLHIYHNGTGDAMMISGANQGTITYQNDNDSVRWAAGSQNNKFIFWNTSGELVANMSPEGNFVAIGEITAGAASDARFKDNQQPLRNADWVLKALRPVEFEWNELYHSLGGRNEGHDVGFLAQEVQTLIPSAISKVYGDYLRLDYNKVTPYLVAGWQMHETEIDRLRRRVAQLERQLNIN